MDFKKTISVNIVLLVISVSSIFSQSATQMVIEDTRFSNNGPNSYSQNVRFEFRYRPSSGVPGTGNFGGLMTIAPWIPDGTGNKNHQLHFNDGGIFYRTGISNSSTWEGWRQILITNENGHVGIGTTNPQNLLDVNGTIHAREVKVDLTGWSDFVFHPSYQLKPLTEVEKFIKTNGHLHDIPSAAEVEQNGVNVGEMQKKLLQKVEELTLYVIEKDKESKEQSKLIIEQNLKLEAQQKILLELKKEIENLKTK